MLLFVKSSSLSSITYRSSCLKKLFCAFSLRGFSWYFSILKGSLKSDIWEVSIGGRTYLILSRILMASSILEFWYSSLAISMWQSTHCVVDTWSICSSLAKIIWDNCVATLKFPIRFRNFKYSRLPSIYVG